MKTRSSWWSLTRTVWIRYDVFRGRWSGCVDGGRGGEVEVVVVESEFEELVSRRRIVTRGLSIDIIQPRVWSGGSTSVSLDKPSVHTSTLGVGVNNILYLILTLGIVPDIPNTPDRRGEERSGGNGVGVERETREWCDRRKVREIDWS